MNASKYLVATKEKQGVRKNDFSYAEEGHIATFGSMCDNATPDDKCGCARAMITPSNAKATTTVKVVELTEEQQRQALAETLNHFTKDWGFPEEQATKMATDELNQNHDIAKQFETGSVLEIRGSKIAVRA